MAVAVNRVIRAALAWSLWGVFVTGTLSSLLWVRGFDFFVGHSTLPLLGILALPVIGGVVTPEKPAYTVVVFAIGSHVPLFGTIPIGLIPFLRMYDILSSNLTENKWQVLREIPLLIVGTVWEAFWMAVILFAPLVYFGWTLRRRRQSE